MKIKHVSIKDLPVRVTKKGKKRGRPSKAEMTMSKLCSHELKKSFGEIQKVINDMFFYGTGVYKTTWRRRNKCSVRIQKSIQRSVDAMRN